jgi:hypothetical protein
MEMTTVETETTEPAGETVAATTPVPGTTIAPEASVEKQVEPHPKVSTQVVICEATIEYAAPLRSAPMPKVGSSSRGGLELLDDDLIDPAFVSLSMESWHETEN